MKGKHRKPKWTDEEIKDAIRTGYLTPFYHFTSNKTKINNIRCEICEYCIPRANKLLCCGKALCSTCLIYCYSRNELHNGKCICCTCKTIGIAANSTIDDFDVDEKNSIPKIATKDDIYKVAEEYGIPMEVVDEILKSEEVIEELQYEFLNDSSDL
ncbi:hypothetical protein TRFO_01011 [Tritrichomonas foetus]|uniref:Uncharacterized protein n=1 Tax=Tritrichomonas foetus TaxID=1144522 RepID=A0A1J4L2G2_9EUKA|nr:hypothetical protein TRFO_01011 [Tritrichomonas foetus]|eukprot:OHT17697.1 hypothetical protein TRFO_01011 [Tritrichomonas foetus]